ncbi:hypothetical protein SAY87_032379 [Trapa incisa]|uniref:Uncharacterized protein n=1 Tax=Trapa incisa TaxID=236973 RepID=A0AAN7GNX2_9MYRT|nr:hypothetical protein SAY87_032379 [Trapa incisa]
MAGHSSSSSSLKKKKKNTRSSRFYKLFHGSDEHDNAGDDDLYNLELQESDVVWGNHGGSSMAASSSSKNSAAIPPAFASSGKKKPLKHASMAASLPVSVPDWSRVQRHRSGGEEGEATDTPGTEWLPPHEYLARQRGESLSVEEGMGRTLKGMELCRFRNEILKKLVGFED